MTPTLKFMVTPGMWLPPSMVHNSTAEPCSHPLNASTSLSTPSMPPSRSSASTVLVGVVSQPLYATQCCTVCGALGYSTLAMEPDGGGVMLAELRLDGTHLIFQQVGADSGTAPLKFERN